MTKDPYKYFRIEARELLDGLTQGVLELERGANGQERIANLLRLAHTLKGASRVVKQPVIAELAHSIESVLEPHRGGVSPVPREGVREVLRLTDGIAASLSGLESIVNRGGSTTVRATSEEAFETVRVEVEEVDAVLDNLSEAGVRLTAIRQQAEGIERAKRLARLATENVSAGNGSPNLKTRELIEELSSFLDRLGRGLTVNVEHAERELAQAKERANHLRLLPARMIFPALERAGRDAAQVLGKRIEVHAAGGDIRLEAHVLLALRDALLHLVRNAVAHGIENEAVRAAAAKPAAGRVEVCVERRGGSVIFTCRDDGGGIDVEAIRRVAVTRGVISPSRCESVGLNEAIDLILRGGVSTTGVVTEVSGRGIGLDVVREAAARLKGNITVDTAQGRGTTVQVCVPVTLASVPALLVESGGMGASIPLESVRQTQLVADGEISRSGGKESISYEGQMIPFCPLSRALGRQQLQEDRRLRWPVVLVASGPRLVALGVDRLLGLQTVLVHRLPVVAAADPVVAGASLNAEGFPQLVLDPEGLIEAGCNVGPVVPRVAGSARRPILVIDDSLTTRMLEQSILESAGHTVELACSAEEGWDKAKARQYSLFLVDVEMPGMDGFEFVARTRADAVLREVPAMLVTSRNSAADRRRGEEVGAHAYIVKGEFDQSFLLQRIRQLLGQP